MINDLLENFPEPYRSKISKNSNNDEKYSDHVEALYHAFDWNKTIEGPKYWRNFYGSLVNVTSININRKNEKSEDSVNYKCLLAEYL